MSARERLEGWIPYLDAKLEEEEPLGEGIVLAIRNDIAAALATLASPALEAEGREETGVVQFGDDWPGVFIRGDSAMNFAMALGDIIPDTAEETDVALMMSCKAAHSLRDLLLSCDVRSGTKPTRLRPPRATEEMVERIAAWLFEEQRVARWAEASEGDRVVYRDDARLLLTETGIIREDSDHE